MEATSPLARSNTVVEFTGNYGSYHCTSSSEANLQEIMRIEEDAEADMHSPFVMLKFDIS